MWPCDDYLLLEHFVEDVNLATFFLELFFGCSEAGHHLLVLAHLLRYEVHMQTCALLCTRHSGRPLFRHCAKVRPPVDHMGCDWRGTAVPHLISFHQASIWQMSMRQTQRDKQVGFELASFHLLVRNAPSQSCRPFICKLANTWLLSYRHVQTRAHLYFILFCTVVYFILSCAIASCAIAS